MAEKPGESDTPAKQESEEQGKTASTRPSIVSILLGVVIIGGWLLVQGLAAGTLQTPISTAFSQIGNMLQKSPK